MRATRRRFAASLDIGQCPSQDQDDRHEDAQRTAPDHQRGGHAPAVPPRA